MVARYQDSKKSGYPTMQRPETYKLQHLYRMMFFLNEEQKVI